MRFVLRPMTLAGIVPSKRSFQNLHIARSRVLLAPAVGTEAFFFAKEVRVEKRRSRFAG